MPSATLKQPVRLLWVKFSITSKTEDIKAIFADFPDLKEFREVKTNRYELLVEHRGTDYVGIVKHRLDTHQIRRGSLDHYDSWYMDIELSMDVKPGLREQMAGRIKQALGSDVTVMWINANSIRVTSTRQLKKRDFTNIHMALAT